MITWDEYYRMEMERTEQCKKRLEIAAIVVIAIFISVNIFIGVFTW